MVLDELTAEEAKAVVGRLDAEIGERLGRLSALAGDLDDLGRQLDGHLCGEPDRVGEHVAGVTWIVGHELTDAFVGLDRLLAIRHERWGRGLQAVAWGSRPAPVVTSPEDVSATSFADSTPFIPEGRSRWLRWLFGQTAEAVRRVHDGYGALDVFAVHAGVHRARGLGDEVVRAHQAWLDLLHRYSTVEPVAAP